MKIVLKQKVLNWFNLDNYYVYDEHNNVLFQIKGKMALGKLVKIYNSNGIEVGSIKQKIITALPKLEFYINSNYIGDFELKPAFMKRHCEFKEYGLTIKGNYYGTKYETYDSNNNIIMSINRKLFKIQDTYEIEVLDERYSLISLMIAISLDLIYHGSSDNTDNL